MVELPARPAELVAAGIWNHRRGSRLNWVREDGRVKPRFAARHRSAGFLCVAAQLLIGTAHLGVSGAEAGGEPANGVAVRVD